MNNSAKERLQLVIPDIWVACQAAMYEEGPGSTTKLGILAVNPGGGGQVVCRFDAELFLQDLAEVLNMARLEAIQPEKAKAEYQALKLLRQLG